VFRTLALLSATQPLSRPVPGEAADAYLRSAGEAKTERRAAWRRLSFLASGQDRFRLDRFPAGAQRILWIYSGETQVGDALMDLAPRSLLAESGLAVDLLADPAIASLFHGDPWLKRVGSDPAAFQHTQYDCAIVLSNKRRPLAPKMRSFRRLPWVSLHESFTGPNFQRAAFAAQRLADLLGKALSDNELQRHARQKLRPLPVAEHASPGDAPGAIALVVGGVRSDRTYGRWGDVMRALVSAGHTAFVLVGSDNGTSEASELTRELATVATITDYTGRLSLAQTRAVLGDAAVVGCPDGGLMHLALTTETAVVPLFSAQISPAWRLAADQVGAAVQAQSGGVQDIQPEHVASALLRALGTAR
jgi:ADP-heptose:LPS heptosyltransferase